MLSDKKYIKWKLIYFCIDSCKELFNIEDASQVIGSFLINPQLKCFDFSQTFHGLLLSLQKKIEIKIFMNQSQESLEKSSWISIAMLWCRISCCFADYTAQTRIKYTRFNRNPSNEISNIEISNFRWQFKHEWGDICNNKNDVAHPTKKQRQFGIL